MREPVLAMLLRRQPGWLPPEPLDREMEPEELERLEELAPGCLVARTGLAQVGECEGGSLRVESPSREVAPLAIRPRGNVARLLIGATLLAALSRKGDIRCRVEVGEETVVGVECADAEGPIELPMDVLAAAAGADIRVHCEGQSISLAFPRASAARQRTPERA